MKSEIRSEIKSKAQDILECYFEGKQEYPGFGSNDITMARLNLVDTVVSRYWFE